MVGDGGVTGIGILAEQQVEGQAALDVGRFLQEVLEQGGEPFFVVVFFDGVGQYRQFVETFGLVNLFGDLRDRRVRGDSRLLE